jgi:cytochrome P450
VLTREQPPGLKIHERGGKGGGRLPGPSGVALLGAVALGGERITGFFDRAARRHPRIAHVRLGPEHVYLLNSPDLVHDVLVRQARSTMKGRGIQATRQLLGNGLLTSEGERHRTSRRLLQPAFSHRGISRYAEDMTSLTAELSQAWAQGPRDVDMAAQMSTLTLQIVGRALFGRDLLPESGEVSTALGQAMASFRRAVLPGGRLLLRLPLPSSRRAFTARDRLVAVVQRTIAERRESSGDGERADVLSTLLDAGMSEKQVRDEVMTLLLAGHETTATALTWTWILLARHPHEAAKLHAHLGTDSSQSYVSAVIAEAMRLRPPAWLIGRRLTADVEIDDWHLPAGSLAVASQWVLHRDERFWPQAREFRPARWLDAAGRFDEQAPGQPRGAWFPFGLGHRTCIGEHFAWTEAELVLTMLASRWSPMLVNRSEVGIRPAVTLRPTSPVVMRLVDRGEWS